MNWGAPLTIPLQVRLPASVKVCVPEWLIIGRVIPAGGVSVWVPTVPLMSSCDVVELVALVNRCMSSAAMGSVSFEVPCMSSAPPDTIKVVLMVSFMAVGICRVPFEMVNTPTLKILLAVHPPPLPVIARLLNSVLERVEIVLPVLVPLNATVPELLVNVPPVCVQLPATVNVVSVLPDGAVSVPPVCIVTSPLQAIVAPAAESVPVPLE